MIFLFPISSVLFAVALFLLFVASIFDSSIQMYSLLESNMAYVILFLFVRAILSISSYIISSKKNDKEITTIRIIIEITSNILFIIAIVLFIKDMSGLYIDHPFITAICSFFSLITIGGSMLFSINMNDFFNPDADNTSSIFLIIVSIFIIIVSLIPDSNGITKILLNALFAFITSIGYETIHDI